MFASIPSFGLGTFRLQGQTVIDSVATGLDVGYRHIDTADLRQRSRSRPGHCRQRCGA